MQSEKGIGHNVAGEWQKSLATNRLRSQKR